MHANDKKNRNKAIEIGCGLGDIIRRLDFNEKVGVDNDKQVLNAARFISRFFDKNKTEFIFYDLVNSDALNETYDLVLIPNFAHAINSEILKKKIEHIFLNNLTNTGELILDVIEDKNLKIIKIFIQLIIYRINRLQDT